MLSLIKRLVGSVPNTVSNRKILFLDTAGNLQLKDHEGDTEQVALMADVVGADGLQPSTTIAGNATLELPNLVYFVNNADNAVTLTVSPAEFTNKIVTVKVIGEDPGEVDREVEVTVSSGVIVITDVASAIDTFDFTTLGETQRFYSNGTNLYTI